MKPRELMGRAIPAAQTALDSKPYDFANMLKAVAMISRRNMNLRSALARPYVVRMEVAMRWANCGRQKGGAKL